MNNVLIYKKLISLLELKLNEELKNEGNRNFKLNDEMFSLLYFQSRNGHELFMMENLLYMIFGYHYNEIKEQITQEQEVIRNEIKDLDEYVESLKKRPITTNEAFEKKEYNQKVIGNIHFINDGEFIVDDILTVQKTPIIAFGIAENIDDLTEFEKLLNTHSNEISLASIMNSDFKKQNRVIDNLIRLETLDKIKKIIPVINDDFVLNKRLDELKKIEQRLKKLPKSQRGELVQIQQQINTIKSWL